MYIICAYNGISCARRTDQYDCIVVDECHWGYLLDRELSDTELTFRGFQDYISKYRRVLDYFDAVRIGLTATPALHTTEIFSAPIFTAATARRSSTATSSTTNRRVQIITMPSKDGITYKVGEKHGLSSENQHHNQLQHPGLKSSSTCRISTARSSPSPSTAWFSRGIRESARSRLGLGKP